MFTAVKRIKEAFEEGGPLVSCWNVQGGWNLNRQVAWIKEDDIPYLPAIHCPLIQQGANMSNRWDKWISEFRQSVEWINEQKLPVTIRWHNWLQGFYDKEQNRPPFEQSALVHFRKPDGTLEDVATVDPLSPVQPWIDEGKVIATTMWLRNLAELLPNVPRVFFLENNEANIVELGNYTEQTTEKDQWGYRLRKWKPALETISVRMAEFATTHDANQCEIAIDEGYAKNYSALNASIKENVPTQWKDKVYTAGYSGLLLTAQAGLLKQTFSYKRPQSPWPPPNTRRFDELSDRCYDDGSGSAANWHDWVRSPQHLQHNLSVVNAHLNETRSLWHDDRSFFISQARCRAAAEGHGGYVLPPRVLGFARACLWSDITKNRATVLRWFAESQEQLLDQWYNAVNDPEELKSYTTLDFYNMAVKAVMEVWNTPRLKWFFREGDPIINHDPHFCNWELPPSVVDNRSRVLYTDADVPRYKNGKDTWRDSNGMLPLNVWCQGWRLDGRVLLYLWSPHGKRSNVTVKVPAPENGGLLHVLVPQVDEDGIFKEVLMVDTVH